MMRLFEVQSAGIYQLKSENRMDQFPGLYGRFCHEVGGPSILLVRNSRYLPQICPTRQLQEPGLPSRLPDKTVFVASRLVNSSSLALISASLAFCSSADSLAETVAYFSEIK